MLAAVAGRCAPTAPPAAPAGARPAAAAGRWLPPQHGRLRRSHGKASAAGLALLRSSSGSRSPPVATPAPTCDVCVNCPLCLGEGLHGLRSIQHDDALCTRRRAGRVRVRRGAAAQQQRTSLWVQHADHLAPLPCLPSPARLPALPDHHGPGTPSRGLTNLCVAQRQAQPRRLHRHKQRRGPGPDGAHALVACDEGNDRGAGEEAAGQRGSSAGSSAAGMPPTNARSSTCARRHPVPTLLPSTAAQAQLAHPHRFCGSQSRAQPRTRYPPPSCAQT